MIYKTITYHDYKEVEHTKDFYFSLNQTEFALLNNNLPGGFELYLKRIQEDHNEEKLLELLTMFIEASYGQWIDDENFVKETPQGLKLGKMFLSTEACDNLITDLLEKENNIGAFLTGMLPKNIRGNVEAKIKEASDPEEAGQKEARVVTFPTAEQPAD